MRTLNVPALSGPGRGRARVVGSLIWLGFIVFPLVNAVTNRDPALKHAFAIAGAALFTAVYLALVLRWGSFQTTTEYQRGYVPLALFTALLVVAAALTLVDGSGWGFLFIYASACAAMVAPVPYGLAAIGLCVGLGAGCTALADGSGGAVIGVVSSCAGIGLLMLLMRDLRIRNEELIEARAELARLAVAEERERFARDLHDLLGHSLSVITLKAELAGRLLPDHPQQAAGEIAELEQVARTALSEVREAVSGYRQPTLEGELAGARMALLAAGIAAEVEMPGVALDPSVEAVLAWAVREGATNAIRHSRAHHCAIRIAAGLSAASVEVVDDGPGPESVNGKDGHGLVGLAERAEALHGRLESGPRPGGGFRLLVSVPSL